MCRSRNDFKIYLSALFVLFCYFFNYALFYFIFIQSFCFYQNCLKVYFRMTIYFLEDFYGFICLFCYLQYIKQVFVALLCCKVSFFWTLSRILMGFYFINVIITFYIYRNIAENKSKVSVFGLFIHSTNVKPYE